MKGLKGNVLSTMARVHWWAPILLSGLIVSMQYPAHGSTSKPGQVSFSKAYRSFQKLSQTPGGTADQWRELIASFNTLRASRKSAVANRSLFLAGKSYIELYRRTGLTKDLDEAITCLSAFNRANRSGPYWIMALRELKAAHLLKRKIGQSPRVKPRSSPPAFNVPANASYMPKVPVTSHGGRIAGGVPPGIGPRVITREPSTEPPNRPTVHNMTGNPFCPQGAARRAQVPVEVPSVPPPAASTPRPEQRASLPSVSVTDGVPDSPKVKKSKGFVVVIDPGHGGKDPGAVSKDGVLKEKDITLEVSKRVKGFLEKRLKGITVALTRTDDRFLSLTDRTAFANALNADLFISVHCNSATDSTSKGIETFYLSKASSPRAMRVAARENGIPLSKMTDLDATLLDLTMTSKKTESDKLAGAVHRSLSQALIRQLPGTRDRGVKRAPFYVLLGAKMPAILVECAFISNGADRNKLTSPGHLDCIADGIVRGATTYMHGLGEKS